MIAIGSKGVGTLQINAIYDKCAVYCQRVSDELMIFFNSKIFKKHLLFCSMYFNIDNSTTEVTVWEQTWAKNKNRWVIPLVPTF